MIPHWLLIALCTVLGFFYIKKKSPEGDITLDNTDLLLHHGICNEQQTFVEAYGKPERETVSDTKVGLKL